MEMRKGRLSLVNGPSDDQVLKGAVSPLMQVSKAAIGRKVQGTGDSICLN